MPSCLRPFLLLVASALAGVATAKPEQIRAVQEPIYHYYLQSHPSDPAIAVMGPEDTSEFFDISGSIQSTNTSMYLNVGDDSTSYKTLTFSETAETTAWALEGDTIITATGSEFGRQLNFLVCKLEGDYWQVYLQTGADAPSTGECSNFQSLHLPCLC